MFDMPDRDWFRAILAFMLIPILALPMLGLAVLAMLDPNKEDYIETAFDLPNRIAERIIPRRNNP